MMSEGERNDGGTQPGAARGLGGMEAAADAGTTSEAAEDAGREELPGIPATEVDIGGGPALGRDGED